MAAASPLAFGAKKLPVGLELYSVRNELKQDLTGTVRAVAKMGYEVVEFFSPYYVWTTEQTKDMRKLLDDLGIKCLSTHNDAKNFLPDNLAKTADMNSILGAKYVVMASAGRPAGWPAGRRSPRRSIEPPILGNPPACVPAITTIRPSSRPWRAINNAPSTSSPLRLIRT